MYFVAYAHKYVLKVYWKQSLTSITTISNQTKMNYVIAHFSTILQTICSFIVKETTTFL
jgi:hypothetical protein